MEDDEALRRDLHSVRAEAGPTGSPRLVAERGQTDGHGDRFWALALACSAAAANVHPPAGAYVAGDPNKSIDRPPYTIPLNTTKTTGCRGTRSVAKRPYLIPSVAAKT